MDFSKVANRPPIGLFFAEKILDLSKITNWLPNFLDVYKRDPLSPLLFVLVMDVLAALFSAAEEKGLFSSLLDRGVKYRLSLFADDVALVIKPVEREIRVALLIFDLFGDASGLRVNYAKSAATLIRCGDLDEDQILQILPCQAAQFPCTYLGLPLALKRLPKACLQSYVEKLALRLPTWRGAMLDVQGRAVLVKAVLTAMSIYVMMALDLPVWMLNALEAICRGFLWSAKASAKGGDCPIAWDVVCLPTKLGGLGIRNLHILNDALSMKWLWLSRVHDAKPWTANSIQCSAKARAVFCASTTVSVGNGRSCLFWCDRWIDNQDVGALAPLLLDHVDVKILNSRTVEDALTNNQWIRDLRTGLSVPAIMQYLALWTTLSTVHLSPDVDDSLRWIWTANKCFSAKSAYLAFFEGRTLWPWSESIWNCKAPLKYKIFAWKVVWNRCWTNDRRKRHRLTNDDTCALCLQEKETIGHLLLQCSYSRVVWFEVTRGLGRGVDAPTASDELLSWWPRFADSWTPSSRSSIRALMMLVLRYIWLERNNRVFKNVSKPETVLLDSILLEAERWKAVGFCE